MDKYSFISDLMKNKSLTHSQKERLYELIGKDIIRNLDQKGDNIFQELRVIKNKMELIERNVNKENNNNKQNLTKKRTKTHNPKEMLKFLFQFSSQEGYKWFTHKPDLRIDEINYLSKLESIKKYKMPFDINIATYMFMRSFFLKDKNSNDKLNIFYPNFTTELTYSNEKILTKIKKGINPFDIVIDGIYFADVINKFKNAIEFRSDNDKYKFNTLFMDFITNNLSIDINEKYTDDFKNNSKSLSTYIDVNNFFRGINLILKEWLNKYKSLSNELIIDLKNENDYYLLSFFQKGGEIQNKPTSTKLNGLAGDFNTLRKYWFSIVDLEIKADFAENKKPHKIICLNNETQLTVNDAKLSKNVIKPLQDTVGGVMYLIKIYKNN